MSENSFRENSFGELNCIERTVFAHSLSRTDVNLREEILKLTARRDRRLAEEFLQKLKIAQQEAATESSSNGAPSKINLWELPEALEKRLNLAENLLSTGDIERALQFADPVLGYVTISTVDFLSQLREKDAAAADQRYAIMLANTRGNMPADANTISVLSSYIFTPHTFVIFKTDGSAETLSTTSPFPAAIVSPQLRLAFFQTAANVLLRPQRLPEQDQSTIGIAGKYMVLKRLMPLFEQYAPKEITDAIRNQFDAVNGMVRDNVRQNEDEWIRKGISPEKEVAADQEQSLIERIERAKTSDERDELYFQLALLVLNKDNPRARDYVSKIDESEFRKRAQAWVDSCLVINAIKKKKVEVALELARTAELTPILRVWVLTQSAKLLAKTDRDKALSLLDDATAEVRRIETAPDRPRGLLATPMLY